MADLQKRKNWQDPSVQHDWALGQVTGGDKIATEHWEEIKKAKSREEARQLWSKYFERPAASSGGGWQKLSSNNWNVSDRAIAYEQGRSGNSVVWMSPDDYLAMTPPIEDGQGNRSKMQSLRKSLLLGEDVEAIPTLDVSCKGDKLTVIDQDGRNRAQFAKDEGIGLIPVAVHGAGAGAAQIEDMRGRTSPFDFAAVPKAEAPREASSPIGRVAGGDLAASQRFWSGVRDPIEGATQLASHLLPESVSSAINRLNNFLADQGVPLGKIPEGGIDQFERQREESLRSAGVGAPGEDLPRLAGNVAATIPLAALGGGGAGMGAALRAGAIQGGAGGALAPVASEGDFWSQKGAQAGLGAATGGVLGAAGQAVGSAIAPQILPAAQRLLDRGIRLTPGQLFGGGRKATEEVTASIPFSGHAVSAAFRRGIEDFDRAVYDEVLRPIGQRFRGTAIGHDGIDQLERQLSAEYERLKPLIEFRADNGFKQDLDNLRVLASEMPADEARQFAAILKNRVVQRLGRQGTMDGETFKTVESELSQKSRQLSRSDVAGQRDLGKAVDEINGMLRANLERSNPRIAEDLHNLNTAWAAFARARRASVNRPTSGGVFTPGDLLRAEKYAAGERVFARGDGLLQDIARDGQEVMASKVPDSGTARRYATLAEIGELGATALHNPAAAAAQLGAHGAHALAYTSPGVAFLRMLAGTGFPHARRTLADVPRYGVRLLAPPVGFNAGVLADQQNR